MLGIFLLRLDGLSLLANGTVSAVNSTAVVSNVRPSYNGITLTCSEVTDPISIGTVLIMRVAGECNCTQNTNKMIEDTHLVLDIYK